VVCVWFGAPFELELVRARVRRSLDRIEALTLALPPPGGPDSDSGAGKMPA
jgi:hypothetical protein